MTIDWHGKLKFYPHFDAFIAEDNVKALVSDPARVAANKFYPFIRYHQRWQPFRKRDGGKPDVKERPIRFASRRDSYILSYYRHQLSRDYERLISESNISESVIAYRRLRQSNNSGKSTIDLAKDAFDEIQRLGNCVVVALDISSFFESLDHSRLEMQWLRVIGNKELPQDHAAIFRAVTRYAFVDRDELYERLGYAEKQSFKGQSRFVYKVNPRDIPTKICSNKDFRLKVCGSGSKYKSIIKLNRKPYGIPQGSPISDLLANMYMIDYDISCHKYCIERGGVYYRYSDDILMIIPGSDDVALEARDFAMNGITKQGNKLLIKKSKTFGLVYEKSNNQNIFRHIFGEQGKNGLEYLGFRFDGRNAFIRDSTISRFYRKISGSVNSECRSLIDRYPDKGVDFLTSCFNIDRFMQKYGRVENFDSKNGYRSWTFWTYVRRSATAFGSRGRPITRQVIRYKQNIRNRIQKQIRRRLTSKFFIEILSDDII